METRALSPLEEHISGSKTEVSILSPLVMVKVISAIGVYQYPLAATVR